MLKESIPIERAQMRLQLIIPGKEARRLREKVVKLTSKVESEDWDGGTVCIVCLIDPGQYRAVNDVVQTETKGQGQLELLSLMEVTQGEEVLE